MIKYFNIIQALCRSSLSNPNDAILHQITRLKESMEKDGYIKEAKSLSALMASSKKSAEMSPSKIQKSFIAGASQTLTTQTPIPVDKETSTPLAEIFFEEDLPQEMPIFGEDIKTAIKTTITEWGKYEELLKISASPTSSCLIYGLPGTGKTHLAKWMAKQTGMPVVLARLEGLMSSFLGTTSRNIGNLFAFADRYKCVLLLDEFDAIAKLRDDPQEVGEVKRVVNTLLQCLDSRHEKGFTIGVTNHESLLDPAVWRRFDIQIEVPKPPLNVMMELLRKFIKPLNFDEYEIKFLAWCLEDSAGADAQMLSRWIKRASVVEPDNGLIFTMKQFALLNSARINSNRRNILIHSDEELIIALLTEKNYSFKQKEVASLFGITPSSLSKQLSKIKESEKS